MTDEMERNIEAIEEEKEEYLDEHPEEDVEVEEIEFSLNEEEIEEWINELSLLKENKNQITLSVDEETDLKISFSEENSSEGLENSDEKSNEDNEGELIG